MRYLILLVTCGLGLHAWTLTDKEFPWSGLSWRCRRCGRIRWP
jgi:hypothetical protein